MHDERQPRFNAFHAIERQNPPLVYENWNNEKEGHGGREVCECIHNEDADLIAALLNQDYALFGKTQC